MRQPRGDWLSPATDAMLERYAGEHVQARIFELYIRKLGEEEEMLTYVRQHHGGIVNEEAGQEITGARIDELRKTRRAELLLTPFHKEQDGYRMIVLGKVVPSTGMYMPGSTVPFILGLPENRYMARVSEHQARVLLDQCVDLADNGLVPGNELDELE